MTRKLVIQFSFHIKSALKKCQGRKVPTKSCAQRGETRMVKTANAEICIVDTSRWGTSCVKNMSGDNVESGRLLRAGLRDSRTGVYGSRWKVRDLRLKVGSDEGWEVGVQGLWHAPPVVGNKDVWPHDVAQCNLLRVCALRLRGLGLTFMVKGVGFRV